ncbi:hypothetical protein C8N46_103321 [Kordia periserrulae]|uniref:Bacteriocin-like protein n=1 Tax=Kordia periserrulae TaxID=701523 RepID=A0A2T6C1M1_9FLAO|nr:hypothetical protein [Kordia periserrulae]PTX62222.1 hypothetical protein C8N46_103321 [Kordia periserrulae]
MKKQISSIGKVLSKEEQRTINGGALVAEPFPFECPIVLLAAPPEGCYYVTVPTIPCPSYKLVCDDIFPYQA